MLNRRRVVFLTMLVVFVASMVAEGYLAVVSGNYAPFDEVVALWFIVYIALALLMPRIAKSSKPSK
jgi:uncharacterized membrane protein AbrB (regulator of aidB expression)